jgi:hypothetical protein
MSPAEKSSSKAWLNGRGIGAQEALKVLFEKHFSPRALLVFSEF